MFDTIPLIALERAQIIATSPTPKVVFHRPEVTEDGELTGDFEEVVTVYLEAGVSTLKQLVPFLRSEDVTTCEAHGAAFLANQGRQSRVGNPLHNQIGANQTYTPSTQDQASLIMQRTVAMLTKEVQQLKADPARRGGPVKAINKKPEVKSVEVPKETPQASKPVEPVEPVEKVEPAQGKETPQAL